MNESICRVRICEPEKDGHDDTQAAIFSHGIAGLLIKVEQLEQRIQEAEQFYLATSKTQLDSTKGSSIVKGKYKDKCISGVPKLQEDSSHREASASMRTQELMRQFATILRLITRHKFAWPFMHPVDVNGLGLPDYYEVIKKPMDFATIINQMESKDGTGYKNVRELCADVRLIFENAMKYNEETNDVHVMAKALSGKFEEKWLQLLPKVVEEEKRQNEEADVISEMQQSQEAAHRKITMDIGNELYEIDSRLDELREIVVRKCRKFSTEDKRNLGAALVRLSPEDLSQALEIVAEDNPCFSATAEVVDLDIDAQSESTLWRLKFFVKEALAAPGKSSASAHGNTNNSSIQKRRISGAPPAKKKGH